MCSCLDPMASWSWKPPFRACRAIMMQCRVAQSNMLIIPDANIIDTVQCSKCNCQEARAHGDQCSPCWLIRGEISLAGGSIRVNVSTVNPNVLWRERSTKRGWVELISRGCHNFQMEQLCFMACVDLGSHLLLTPSHFFSK